MRPDRRMVAELAAVMIVVFLVAGGVLALFGEFVRTVTMLAVAVASAAIYVLLDRPCS